MATGWLADLNVVMHGVRLTWDFLRALLKHEREPYHRAGIKALLDASLRLRRYARALEDYCTAVQSEHRSTTEEGVLLLDALRERASLADFFGQQAYQAVLTCVPGAKEDAGLQSGWFQRRPFHNWVRAAHMYGPQVYGLTQEHLDLLDRISASHEAFQRDYDTDAACDDEPLAPLPEILADEQMIADVKRVATAARDLAAEIDKIVRENWTLKEALSEVDAVVKT